MNTDRTSAVRSAFRAANMSRRDFIRRNGNLVGGIGVAGLCGCASVSANAAKKTDIRIDTVSTSYEEHLYRAPVKFARAVMDRASILTVQCSVHTRDGRSASGIGTMPFNHIFSYPSKSMSQEAKNNAMKALAGEIARVTQNHDSFAHPLELNAELAPLYFKAAAEVSRQLALPDPIPRLCTLVTSSAFDSAIHDAFGKMHGVSCFHTYSAAFMNRDLSHYLGAAFHGRYPGDYFSREPKPEMPISHLISAADPIEAFENTKPINDGLPETLPEWIQHNGLTEFKIKVNGDDLKWDVERVIHIDRVVAAAQQQRGVTRWFYVLDFNEKCPDLDYFMRFLLELKARIPAGFSRIKYVEQPVSRDLRAHPENRMHEVAKVCPVVIDESVIDVESVEFAREMGWTGAVVKSPKGFSQMLLITCAAMQEKIFLCGGDMSCPGRALVQTANFQAHVPGITAVEANARQYLPQANRGWESKYPGIFTTANGMLQTRELNGPGLGA